MLCSIPIVISCIQAQLPSQTTANAHHTAKLLEAFIPLPYHFHPHNANIAHRNSRFCLLCVAPLREHRRPLVLSTPAVFSCFCAPGEARRHPTQVMFQDPHTWMVTAAARRQSRNRPKKASRHGVPTDITAIKHAQEPVPEIPLPQHHCQNPTPP